MLININWQRCTGNAWCELIPLDLEHPHFNHLEGIYIIWHGGQISHVVRIGQGIIKNRLAEHRKDPDILKYKTEGLFVTWAHVPKSNRDNIEAFLFNELNPYVGSRAPHAIPVAVNLPW